MQNTRRAATYSTIGGLLFFIDWIWQGYLDLSPGADEILHDGSNAAYYLNELLLFVAMCCFLYGLRALRSTNLFSGFMWSIGYYLSYVGMAVFALGTIGFILEGIFGLPSSVLDVIDMGTGIANLALHFGALPLGIALLGKSNLLKSSGILFILQLPVVVLYLFGFVEMNSLFASILIGGLYGVAWFLAGKFLRQSDNMPGAA